MVELSLPGRDRVQGLDVDRVDDRVGGFAPVRVRVQVDDRAGVGDPVPDPVDDLVRGLAPAQNLPSWLVKSRLQPEK